MPSAFENLCGPGKPLRAEPPDAAEYVLRLDGKVVLVTGRGTIGEGWGNGKGRRWIDSHDPDYHDA